VTHHENRPISLTSMLVSMHESEGTHFKCPFYIGLVPRTSWGRPYDGTPPLSLSELAATTSAPNFLSSHHETALSSSLTETLPLCILILTASKHSTMASFSVL